MKLINLTNHSPGCTEQIFLFILNVKRGWAGGAKLNNQLNDKILWTSQFICRSERQMPEEDWELTASAGAKELIIGVETGSEEVRMHMRKKFTNDDTEWQLEEFSRNKLHCFFLMLCERLFQYL